MHKQYRQFPHHVDHFAILKYFHGNDVEKYAQIHVFCNFVFMCAYLSPCVRVRVRVWFDGTT